MLVVIWFDRNHFKYYHKIVRGFYGKYYVGYTNQYNHTIVYIVNLRQYYYDKEHPFHKNRLIRDTILFLEKY